MNQQLHGNIIPIFIQFVLYFLADKQSFTLTLCGAIGSYSTKNLFLFRQIWHSSSRFLAPIFYSLCLCLLFIFSVCPILSLPVEVKKNEDQRKSSPACDDDNNTLARPTWESDLSA